MKTNNTRLSTEEKIGFINNLATMLSAGIPILEAVVSLQEDSKGGQKKILEALVEDLKQGKQVNTSFARFPKTFNSVTVNLLKASEEAGTLDETLKDLVINIRKEAEFADKVKSAMIYPLFIIVLFIGIMILMLTFVIPRISSVFSRLKVDIPLPTQILITTSDFLMNNTLVVIAVTALIVVLTVTLYKMKREIFFNILFSLPVISHLIKEIDITRFGRSLYLLLNSGITVAPSLELCEDVVSKKDVREAIRYAKQHVTSGHQLSEAMKARKKIFPPIMIKITEAGEKTGSLEKSMLDISDHMDYQVSKSLKQLTTLMEPIMLVGVGVLIGGMMMAIIAPMYSIIGQVGSR